jgi:hypothetical protein
MKLGDVMFILDDSLSPEFYLFSGQVYFYNIFAENEAYLGQSSFDEEVGDFFI